MTPERRFGWIYRDDALDKLGHALEAKDLLLSVANDFESNSTIPYHLAQYCARRGQIDQAKQWLGKALLAADGFEAVNRLRKMALDDPDLEPLRRMP
jgi:predicted Zn-dependent protease